MPALSKGSRVDFMGGDALGWEAQAVWPEGPSGTGADIWVELCDHCQIG